MLPNHVKTKTIPAVATKLTSTKPRAKRTRKAHVSRFSLAPSGFVAATPRTLGSETKLRSALYNQPLRVPSPTRAAASSWIPTSSRATAPLLRSSPMTPSSLLSTKSCSPSPRRPRHLPSHVTLALPFLPLVNYPRGFLLDLLPPFSLQIITKVLPQLRARSPPKTMLLPWRFLFFLFRAFTSLPPPCRTFMIPSKGALNLSLASKAPAAGPSHLTSTQILWACLIQLRSMLSTSIVARHAKSASAHRRPWGDT